MNEELVAAVVREVLRELGDAAPGPRAPETTPLCRPRTRPHRLPFAQGELDAVRAATPARVAQGRTGPRYMTDTYIQLRAEHAIAVDAVHSTVEDGLAESLGCLQLESRATDLEDFLLFPNHGRRLSDESRERLEREGSKGADIVIICGDGLSAWAINSNGPELVPALQRSLQAKGYSVHQPLFCHRARVGVQDEIGVILEARATAILVGERPGLGTGDSLSIYTAYGPRLDQDNAEKDCISNIRQLGIPPLEAAAECATLFERTFAAGGGGIKLTRSGL